MDPLLFSVAVLLVASGAIKARSASRLGLGPPILALAELFVAVVLAAVAVSGALGGTLGPWLAVAGVGLVFVSSGRQALAVRDRRRRREATEARRLETYLGMARAQEPDER